MIWMISRQCYSSFKIMLCYFFFSQMRSDVTTFSEQWKSSCLNAFLFIDVGATMNLVMNQYLKLFYSLYLRNMALPYFKIYSSISMSRDRLKQTDQQWLPYIDRLEMQGVISSHYKFYQRSAIPLHIVVHLMLESSLGVVNHQPTLFSALER